MKSKIAKILILSLTLIMIFGSIPALAYESYETYTYSIDGKAVSSPTAYSASDMISSNSIGLSDLDGKALKDTTDIFADSRGNVYLADKGNNRIVILDKYYKVMDVDTADGGTKKSIISTYVDEYGVTNTLNTPEGVYVSDYDPDPEKNTVLPLIYVCDTGNKRVVVFDGNYDYVRTINCPTSPLITSEKFVPNSIAVDKYGRIFIVSYACHEGVIVLANDGTFTGFIGAQKVTYSVIQMLWRRFQSEEQRAASNKNISVSYNNITVDSDGFIYVTSDKIDEEKQQANIKTKLPDYSPVKKLNSTGAQILKRNGFFDPGGEVDVFYPQDVSKINDVALGPEGSWTILDYAHSKFFTYDQNGNLLFAFGTKGSQLGNGVNLKAITYQFVNNAEVAANPDAKPEYYLLALDNTATNGYTITVYSPSDYCEKIISALKNHNEHNYDQAIDDWQEVLTRNNNFDLAYIGIGKALYSQGKYEEAQEVLKNAYEVDYASKAFKEARKEVISKWILVILAGGIILVVLLVKFLGYAKRKNKATALKVGKRTYGEELLYVFHLVFHPFDGFWDLKHERRGSVRAASTLLLITIVTFFYNSIGKGYLFNPRGSNMSILMAALSISLPVLLWAVSNWCLTTLFEGEGSFRDIYIATCYSIAPLSLTFVIATIMTNVMTIDQQKMVTLVIAIGLVWSALLIFFGMVVTHDYSIGKNFITTIGTLVAMLVIMFVALLFSSLLLKMVSFVTGLGKEILNRV